MNRHSRQQRGAILVMMAILIVVLIGIAALALDLGRLFVQRTELQNAADAAALAAAAELDGKSDAQERAKAAAKELLSPVQADRGIYFGGFTPDDDIVNFKFYSSLDPKTPDDGSASPGESLYVELTIDLSQKDEGEGVPLFFLPVLGLIPGVDNVQTEEGTKARALAGRQKELCYRPPFMMCVSNETMAAWTETPDDLTDDLMQPGQMVKLRQHGGGSSYWVPGDFTFLEALVEPGEKAPSLFDYLAGASIASCTPSQISSSPGQAVGPSRKGLNTRFDRYASNGGYDDKEDSGDDAEEYPPAPNIITYKQDSDISDENRISDGAWPRTEYFNDYHRNIPEDDRPVGWDNDGATAPDGLSRWQTYQWELDILGTGTGENPRIPVLTEDSGTFPNHPAVTTSPCDPDDKQTYDPNACHGQPREPNYHCLPPGSVVDPSSQYSNAMCEQLHTTIYGDPTDDPETKDEPPVSLPDRRTMYVAALNCDDLNLHGKIKDLNVQGSVGRFLAFFVTQYARKEPGATEDKFEIFAEYVGLTEENPGIERVVIQLYE
jgi:hypothetical protein